MKIIFSLIAVLFFACFSSAHGIILETIPSGLTAEALNDQRTDPVIIPDEETGHRANYIIGNDRSKWHSNIPTSRAAIFFLTGYFTGKTHEIRRG